MFSNAVLSEGEDGCYDLGLRAGMALAGERQAIRRAQIPCAGQNDSPRRVWLTMRALVSTPSLYLLQIAQLLLFERQHIFEAVDHAPAELHEARPIADPPPPLKCPWANSPSGSQLDLTEAHFSHFSFLSNDLRGRKTTNA
nr:hypothetical protein [Pseudoroseicyclus aestuarii]